METATKVLLIIFYIVAIVAVGYSGISSFLNERRYRIEKEQAEQEFKRVQEQLRQIILRNEKSKFLDNQTVN